jgi:hypothetical protein
MKVELNDAEQRLAAYLAKKRMRANRKHNITDQQISSLDKYDMEVNGIGAEIAFCKAANVYPDLTVATAANTRPVHDCVLNDKTWDVKTTTRKDGQLLVRKYKADEGKLSDYYVLVTGEMPEYTVVGYANKDKIIHRRNLIDLGYGLTYALPQNQLTVW